MDTKKPICFPLIVYYIIIVSLHIFAVNGIVNLMKDNLLLHICYITNISMYLNFFTYALHLLYECRLIPNVFEKQWMKNYFQIAYSISFIVFILFWGMRFFNPKLLHKSGSEDDKLEIEASLNIVLHGGNYLFNFIEHTFIHTGEINKGVGFLFYFTFSSIYFGLIYILYLSIGFEVYGFLSENWYTIIIVVFVGCLLVMSGDLVYKITTYSKDYIKQEPVKQKKAY